MSKIVISVDMEYALEGGDSVVLTKVVNSLQKDITDIYAKFCKENKFDISQRSDIESAAVPFIKQNEAILP